MGIVSGIVVYICIWWVVIFCILPIGVHHDQERAPQEGLAGAPKDPKLKQKFIATTLIAALLWLGVYGLVQMKVIDFREQALETVEEYR